MPHTSNRHLQHTRLRGTPERTPFDSENRSGDKRLHVDESAPPRVERAVERATPRAGDVSWANEEG